MAKKITDKIKEAIIPKAVKTDVVVTAVVGATVPTAIDHSPSLPCLACVGTGLNPKTKDICPVCEGTPQK